MNTVPLHASNSNSSEKCCTGPCGRTLPCTTEYFHRDKSGKYGLTKQCKECRSQELKARHARPEVREHRRVQSHDYHLRPDVHEHDIEFSKAYLSRSDIKEHKKAYRSRPDQMERRRSYRKAHYRRPGMQERSFADNHTRRARERNVSGTHTPEQIQALLKHQKYQCYYCFVKFEKKNEKYVYQIDHTFPLSRVTGTDIPANDISYLVLTCRSCNLKKHDKFPWEFPEGGRLL